MDALKNAIGGNKTNTAGGAQAGQQTDYVDKATDFGVKKSGHEGQFGRDKQEKATDALRGGYEKLTGWSKKLSEVKYGTELAHKAQGAEAGSEVFDVQVYTTRSRAQDQLALAKF
ncbi:hypothetical protein SCUP515_08298 [Seiridium cupressi]